MLNSANGRLIGQLCILALTMAVAPSLSLGQEPQPAAKKVAPKKVKGRLPAHFGRVVSSKQRETIYQLQAQYGEKLAALKAQMAKLLESRDEEIDAVLTADQRRQVAKLREDAKAAREARAKKAEEARELAKDNKGPNTKPAASGEGDDA